MCERIITIDATNFRSGHLCCAIGDDPENRARADSKRAWLEAEFGNGLVFKRLDERGKVFIEYQPIETAWKPLEGANILVINCLWVSGRFKGQGWAVRLLEECLADARAQGRDGIAVVSGSKKKPFLTDKSFYLAQGFQTVDSAPPWFELLFLPLVSGALAPRFTKRVRTGAGGNPAGFTFVWSRQCPFMESVVASMAAQARERGHPVETIRLESAAQARELGSPFGTLGIWWHGRLLTHELMPPEKFARELDRLGSPTDPSGSPVSAYR